MQPHSVPNHTQEDIKNKGSCKALTLNRKLFEVNDSIPEPTKPEATKVDAFKLSTSNVKSKASELDGENMN